MVNKILFRDVKLVALKVIQKSSVIKTLRPHERIPSRSSKDDIVSSALKAEQQKQLGERDAQIAKLKDQLDQKRDDEEYKRECASYASQMYTKATGHQERSVSAPSGKTLNTYTFESEKFRVYMTEKMRVRRLQLFFVFLAFIIGLLRYVSFRHNLVVIFFDYFNKCFAEDSYYLNFSYYFEEILLRSLYLLERFLWDHFPEWSAWIPSIFQFVDLFVRRSSNIQLFIGFWYMVCTLYNERERFNKFAHRLKIMDVRNNIDRESNTDEYILSYYWFQEEIKRDWTVDTRFRMFKIQNDLKRVSYLKYVLSELSTNFPRYCWWMLCFNWFGFLIIVYELMYVTVDFSQFVSARARKTYVNNGEMPILYEYGKIMRVATFIGPAKNFDTPLDVRPKNMAFSKCEEFDPKYHNVRWSYKGPNGHPTRYDDDVTVRTVSLELFTQLAIPSIINRLEDSDAIKFRLNRLGQNFHGVNISKYAVLMGDDVVGNTLDLVWHFHQHYKETSQNAHELELFRLTQR